MERLTWALIGLTVIITMLTAALVSKEFWSA
jgi:hypothetical protein